MNISLMHVNVTCTDDVIRSSYKDGDVFKACRVKYVNAIVMLNRAAYFHFFVCFGVFSSNLVKKSFTKPEGHSFNVSLI